MNRRKVIKTLTITAGGGWLVPATLFSSCRSDDYQPRFFSKKEVTLINEIGEVILPETTDSPGAGTLKVAHFIDVYVQDCASLSDQKKLRNGLKDFVENCLKENKKSFDKLTDDQKHDWLVALDNERQEKTTAGFFPLLKNLILLSYFTSMEGSTKSLRYLPVPGRYQGNYPLQKGDKSWAIG